MRITRWRRWTGVPSREGSYLALVLIVLFCLAIIIGGVQYLSLDTYRQTRMILESDDSFARAEGLIRFLISRWKKDFRYQIEEPLTSRPSGSESGLWDSRNYVLGWEREPIRTRPPAFRASVWIRFTADRPRRTYRFDLILRPPTMLHPRVVHLERVTEEDVEPGRPAERAAAFSRIPADIRAVARREARVEAATLQLARLIDRTPEELMATLSGRGPPPDAGPLERLLTERLVAQGLDRPTERVDLARNAYDMARRLQPSVASAGWIDACAHALAREIVRDSESRTGPKRRLGYQEALALLDAILAGDPESCGAPLVAWDRAHLQVRLRDDWQDPSDLATAKAGALAGMRDTIDRRPRDPIHRSTDIRREELPIMFDLLWRSRVAVGAEVRADGHLLVSVLSDGQRPVVHLESSTPIKPLAWSADGSKIHVAVGPAGSPPTIWTIPLDGTTGERLFPGPLPIGAGPPVPAQWDEDIELREDFESSTFFATGPTSEVGNPGRKFNGVTYVVGRGDRIQAINSIEGNSQIVEIVFSPADRRAALFRHGLGSPTFPLDIETVPDLFAIGNRTSVASLRVPATTDPRFLSWEVIQGRDWFAFLDSASSTGNEVWFVSPVPGSAPTVVRVPIPWERTSLPSEGDWWIERGRMIRSPPGYLVASDRQLQFVPLPGQPGVPAPMPINPEVGALADIRHLSSPPWGQVAYFTASDGRGPSTLYVLDIGSGIARPLVGARADFPGAISARNPVASPIPEVP